MPANRFQPFTTGTNGGVTSTLAVDGLGQLEGRDEVAVQVTILTGSPTVAIQSRLDAALPWVTVQGSITANGIYRIGACRQVQLLGSGTGTFGGGILY